MKAAVATGIVDIDECIHVQEDWPRPTLATAKDGKTGQLVSELDDDHMIVKVWACALAPGDCRLFKGRTDLVQLPKWGRPYVLGSDICGIVVEVPDTQDYFKVGDKIVARFDEPQPHGMCAEYACVKTKFSEKCPAAIPAIEACALPASAAAAKLVATKHVKQGDRVLVLGGSGGVGTFLCQYIKAQGAQFLAATTTQSELVQTLGVDRVINYREENWWQLTSEFGDKPFDLVIDLVNGSNWQKGACSGTKVLKEKATYIQLIPGVETEIDVRLGYIGVVPFVAQIIWRSLYSKFHPRCPTWESTQGLDLRPGDLEGLLKDACDKRIRVVLDPMSPFPFDTKSVREAMKLQRSVHAHGKVVVEIAEED